MTMRASWRLRAEIALWRWGAAPVLLGLLLAAGAACEIAWVQPARDETSRLSRALAAARANGSRAASTAPGGFAAARDWREELPVPRDVVVLLEDVYVQAESEGLAVRGADYQYTRDAASGLVRATLNLTMGGGYPAVRRMLEALLRTHPNLALDAVGLARGADRQGNVHIQASAWFRAADEAPPPARPAATLAIANGAPRP